MVVGVFCLMTSLIGDHGSSGRGYDLSWAGTISFMLVVEPSYLSVG